VKKREAGPNFILQFPLKDFVEIYGQKISLVGGPGKI
jgi:hypothetical protein